MCTVQAIWSLQQLRICDHVECSWRHHGRSERREQDESGRLMWGLCDLSWTSLATLACDSTSLHMENLLLRILHSTHSLNFLIVQGSVIFKTANAVQAHSRQSTTAEICNDSSNRRRHFLFATVRFLAHSPFQSFFRTSEGKHNYRRSRFVVF